MTVGDRHTVTLLTRAGCSLCEMAHATLTRLAGELRFHLVGVDVDARADAGDPSLRAEYGDLLPVVLIDGRQHGYGEVDEELLRLDLGGR